YRDALSYARGLLLSTAFCLVFTFFFSCYAHHLDLHSFPTRRSSDLPLIRLFLLVLILLLMPTLNFLPVWFALSLLRFRLRLKANQKIGRAVQQECRDRSRMPSSA